MAWGGDKTIGFLLAWGDCHNVCSDQNCDYQLIAADRKCQDEPNGWSDLFLTLKVEYRTAHGVGRRQNKRVSTSLGSITFASTKIAAIVWLQQIELDELNTMVNRICFSPRKLTTAKSMAWREHKTRGFPLAWGYCHNVWSVLSYDYRLIKAYITYQDEHNGWYDLCLTLKNEYITENGVGRWKY